VIPGHEFTGRADGPVLLLTSSLGAVGSVWDRQAAVLGRRFRLLRAETRGHGGTPAPPGPYTVDDLAGDLLDLLDAHGLRSVSVCGTSLGAMTAIQLAATAPERVDRLALCCTSAHLPPAGMWLDRARVVREHGTGAVADGVVARWFTPAFSAANRATVTGFTNGLAAVADEGYAACCEAIAAMDLRPRLAAVRAPALVIAGADDRATPPSHARALSDALPSARLAIVPGAHLACVESPDEVTAALVAHLAPDRLDP